MIPSDRIEVYVVSYPNAQELRTQIARLAEELVEHKAWTDPLGDLLWLELAGYEVNAPKNRNVLPELDNLAIMDYKHLKEVYEELVANLESEKAYWKSWQWCLKESGDIRIAINRKACAIKRHFCVNIPSDIITRRPSDMNS